MHALVTGGNGHLGTNLVRCLLARGYKVRTSIRGDSSTEKREALRALGDVEVVAAELENRASLRAAMEGIEVLFHAAAVYSTADEDREQEILDASLRGTENALRAAADAGVGKVVLTSSVVTLPLTDPGEPPRTEAHWTTNLRVPYFRAKTEGERLAWRLGDDLGLNLVTVLPGGILGPGFQRNTPTIDVIESAMGGAFRMGVPRANFTFVDARDAALGHALAAERDVHGRFILVTEQPSLRELVDALHKIDARIMPSIVELPPFLSLVLPTVDAINHALLGTPRTASTDVVATAASGKVWNVSSARARKELGWKPAYNFEQSLRATVEIIAARTKA